MNEATAGSTKSTVAFLSPFEFKPVHVVGEVVVDDDGEHDEDAARRIVEHDEGRIPFADITACAAWAVAATASHPCLLPDD